MPLQQVTYNDISQPLAIAPGAVENYMSAQSSSFGFRNRLINGNFVVWQRGTSGSMTTSPTYVSADRWGVDQASTAGSTFSQSTTVPTGFLYSGKVQRNSSSTTTNNIVLAQALETLNSYDLAGQSVTVSFWAKAGGSFSASSNTLNYNFFYGQGTDQSLANMRSNSWTNQTNSGGTFTLTTSWVRYSYTVSVPATTTQVGLQFYFTPTGTAGADDSFYITGVQLERSSTASAFEYRDIGRELQMCQRYYETGFTWSGGRYSDGYAILNATFKVTKRTSASMSYSGWNNTINPNGSTTDGATFYTFAGTSTVASGNWQAGAEL